jgi:hypothetical protein
LSAMPARRAGIKIPYPPIPSALPRPRTRRESEDRPRHPRAFEHRRHRQIRPRQVGPEESSGDVLAV